LIRTAKNGMLKRKRGEGEGKAVVWWGCLSECNQQKKKSPSAIEQATRMNCFISLRVI
jgi:hypothetical protein